MRGHNVCFYAELAKLSLIIIKDSLLTRALYIDMIMCYHKIDFVISQNRIRDKSLNQIYFVITKIELVISQN